MALFAKFSVVRCPVCGQAGKNLKDVEGDETIGCRNCGAKTRAARWTECDWEPLPHEEERAKIREELEETVRYVKELAVSIDMPMDEVVRTMMQR